MPANAISSRHAEARWPGLERLFAHVPLSDATKDDVFARMSGADRIYHDAGHLALLWDRHQSYAGPAGIAGTRADTLVACAVAFHDCIYDPTRGDSEARSADLWRDASAGSGLDDDARDWVAGTIRATADHLAYAARADACPLEPLRLWMLDLDLTPFGEAPAVFDRNTVQLRAEHKHLGDAQWESNRLKILRRVGAAPAIYRTPTIAALFDEPARQNIARHLAAAAQA